MKNKTITALENICRNRVHAQMDPNIKNAMLFDGIELPVFEVAVITPFRCDNSRWIPGRGWYREIRFSSSPSKSLGGTPPPLVRDELAEKHLQLGMPPQPTRITIDFPTFQWTAFYGAIYGKDIPPIQDVEAGEIDSGVLRLKNGLIIPGKIVVLSDKIVGDTAAHLGKHELVLIERARENGLEAKLQKMLAMSEAQGRQLAVMDQKLAGVPPLVENAKEDMRHAMEEFYRVIYDGFTPKQKAVCDAMLKARNCVREASRILEADKWKGVSPASVSRILKTEIDPAFWRAGKPNPFESRKNSRFRPVVDAAYRRHRVDQDDNESDEIVPIRSQGYKPDETNPETP